MAIKHRKPDGSSRQAARKHAAKAAASTSKKAPKTKAKKATKAVAKKGPAMPVSKVKKTTRPRITPASIPAPMRALLLSIIDENRVEHWLNTPIPALGDHSPARLIRAGRTEPLMQLLRRAGTF